MYRKYLKIQRELSTMGTSGVVGGRRMRGKRDLVFNSYFYYLTSSPTEGYFNMGYFNNKNN